jgi:enoyl-CoA hydratase/carnithine racemase
MNRPQQMNLLTSEMLSALQDSFDAISKDEKIRVVVLGAAGKGFCGGHDLKEIRTLKELPRIEKLFAQCSRMMQTIASLPQPVIAQVQGAAAAAGCQLVAQCDLAVASAAAKFTTPGVNWGFFCSDALAADVTALARKIAEKPRETVAAGKRAFYQQMDMGVEKAYELASGVISSSFAGEEGREGMDAFIDKRPPGRK